MPITYVISNGFSTRVKTQKTSNVHSSSINCHTHSKWPDYEEIQIAYINQGQGKLIISDSSHPYSNGDIFVIGSNIPHQFKTLNQTDDSLHMISLFLQNKPLEHISMKFPN